VSRGLLVLAGCVAVALGGCGGGDDSASTSSTTQEATTASTPHPSQQSTAAKEEGKSKQAGNHSPSKSSSKPNGSGAKEANKDQSSSTKPPKPVKPPAVSSAPKAGSKAPAPGVKTVKGGDNSVQEYGVEAGEPARREASIALATYLNARAEEDWATACSLLAQKPTEQLEKLAGHKADCAEVLAQTGKEAPSMPGSVITEVLSFRGEGDIPGDPSYLIFKGPPGQTLFSMPMYLQGGAWKAGLAQPSELPV
jgi:hypothetical protein